jgi:hypothetical protein
LHIFKLRLYFFRWPKILKILVTTDKPFVKWFSLAYFEKKMLNKFQTVGSKVKTEDHGKPKYLMASPTSEGLTWSNRQWITHPGKVSTIERLCRV